MSKYGDKRASVSAVCAMSYCDDNAVALRVVDGVPDWFCPAHVDLVDERRKRGMP